MVKINLKQKVISKIAESMVITVEEQPFEANIKKPLEECKVAFVTTAGVHLKRQVPFDVKGDASYRVVPGNVNFNELMITHTHYDTKEANKNKNIVFPLEHLNKLADSGIIRSVAPRNYGLMGYIPDIDRLRNNTAVEIADHLTEDQVDICLLSPG